MNSDCGKKAQIASILRACAGFAASLLCGCLYTTHHFNSGRILEPGKTAVTFGMGREKLYEEYCQDAKDGFRNPQGALRCKPRPGSVSFSTPPETTTLAPGVRSQTIPKFSLSYRLGVRGPWGPFTGVEMGWLLEAPTNPGTVEFDLKLGLPLAGRFKARHSLSAGWGVGMWADNSYFAEYAASRGLGPHALYGSYRYTYLATQPAELDSSFDNWKFAHHRRSIHQAALGLYVKLPDWFLAPDFFTPQANFTFPVVSPFVTLDSDRLEPVLVNFNLGFGWTF
ncbi:MAG TPA: hypothetical protein VJ385_10975 [Fibrobacteria bacterium]|nr:hypothetical protein [Fibrobacteria bacterium]